MASGEPRRPPAGRDTDALRATAEASPSWSVVRRVDAEEIAMHERAARRAEAKLERDRESWAAKLEHERRRSAAELQHLRVELVQWAAEHEHPSSGQPVELVDLLIEERKADAEPGDVAADRGPAGPLPRTRPSVHESPPGPAVTLDSGVTVSARTKKERLLLTRPVDASTVAWLRGFGAGDVFYDVGASCGPITLSAGAWHGDRVTVVAVEPGYANFESLARHLWQNGLPSSVIPLQIALLDRTGVEPITYYKTSSAGSSLYAVGAERRDPELVPVETQMVATYRLDDLIDVLGLPEPTHIRIDVDGTEGSLLDGATRTLERGAVEDLLVKIIDQDRSGTRLRSVEQLLERHGYALAETFNGRLATKQRSVADYLFRLADAKTDPPLPSRSSASRSRSR